MKEMMKEFMKKNRKSQKAEKKEKVTSFFDDDMATVGTKKVPLRSKWSVCWTTSVDSTTCNCQQTNIQSITTIQIRTCASDSGIQRICT